MNQPINNLFTANKVLFISSAAFLSVFVLGSIGFFVGRFLKQRKSYSKLVDLELGPQETKCAKLITKSNIQYLEPELKAQKEKETFIYTEEQFVEACKSGNIEIVKGCIAQGINVHINDDKPLRRASCNGRTEIVKLLLANRTNDDLDYRVLCGASFYGHLEVVKVILAAGVNLNLHAEDNLILRVAVTNGYPKIVKLLLEAGANVHVNDDIPLRMASGNGHLEVVKILLEGGANIHAKEDSPLRRASMNGHLEVVEFLLDKGADVYAKQNGALRLASKYCHLEVAKILEEFAKYTEADLVNACKFGDFECVKRCISQGVSVNAVDKGFSALYSAVLGKHDKIVQFLLECDADVNLTGNTRVDSVYILLNAVANGRVVMVEMLLEYGANANLDKLLDKIGIPLNLEIVKLLVRYRANILTQKHIETLKGFCNNKGVSEQIKSEAQKVYDYLVSNSHLLAT